MSLSERVIKSGIWLQSAKLVQLAVSFFITAVLARLLSPGDYGLVGIVTVYANFISIFTMVGFGSAIIQKQDISQTQLSTLYWLNILMGLLSMGVIGGSAGLAARFYGYPELAPLVRLSSLNFLLIPLYQLHRRMMEKDLQFPLLARIDVVTGLLSGMAGITCAYLGLGAFSLVVQSLCLNLFSLISIRLSRPWQPDCCFRLAEVKEMVFFALKMKGAQLSRYFEKDIDMLILGKSLSARGFGFYSLANRIVFFPIRRVAYTFTEILFPSLSKIQAEIDKIRLIYLKTIQIIAIFIFPFILLITLYARPLVVFSLGTAWKDASPIIAILSLVGAIQCIEHISVAIYPAINQPGVSMRLGMIRLLTIGTAAYIGGHYGVLGAATAVLTAKCLLFWVSLSWLKRYLHYSYRDIWASLYGPVLGSLAMVGLSIILPAGEHPSVLGLLAIMAGQLLLYGGVILVFNLKDLRYFFQRLRPGLKGGR